MYKDDSSVSRNFLPGHFNRHLRQLIYETSIFNNFNKFFTNFNNFADYNFISSHNFNFNTTTGNNNVVMPEFILTLYTELIAVFAKMKYVFFFYNFRLPKALANFCGNDMFELI